VTSVLTDAVRRVRREIRAAAERSGRDAREVVLVAVGKTQSARSVTEVVAAGITDVGENRVQEAAAKRPHVPPARWHLIGPLQRNKVAAALESFDVIQTVDRPRLVERMQRQLADRWPARRLPVLLEVNIGSEPQKAGVLPDQALGLARLVMQAPSLDLLGLMAIPPFADDPEASRPYFRELAELRRRLEQELAAGLPKLSMGMSHDYRVAVEEGATMVRVGTAIFGPRRAP